METKTKSLMPAERIASSILVVRSQRVMLDADLAALYGVPTKRFNEAVKRNKDRFLADFMFVLSEGEFGAIMAATILNSARAVEMSVYVVRAFVRMREVISEMQNPSVGSGSFRS